VKRFRALLAGAGLDARVVDACAVHFALVLKWNPTHNLTRVTDEEGAAVVHYLDCALPLLDWASDHGAPGSFVDVGSGAGFPGLVAAVLFPDAAAVLVEPARKRASFLQVAATQLGLKTVTVTAPTSPPPPSSLVLSRATFSAGSRSTLWPYVAPGGTLLAWSSLHDRSTWETEVAMWPGASFTWRPVLLPSLAGAPAAPHGLVAVRRP
jgi:16S rRNA (guanine527-N7)-methyltransferase